VSSFQKARQVDAKACIIENEAKSAGCCQRRSNLGWKVEYGIQTPFEDLPTLQWRSYAREAKTGDVMLFNTRGTAPAVIRFGTGFAYDHVGIVVKLHGKPAGVLEALGEGVSIANLSDFRDYGWWKQYRCISVRRLHALLKPRQITALEEFVEMAIGRKYGLWKPTAMLRRASLLPAQNPDRAFFCSELVACAYKKAELLPRVSASCTYFPGSFAECAHMLLLSGASLGPEERIIFDRSQQKSRRKKKSSKKEGGSGQQASSCLVL